MTDRYATREDFLRKRKFVSFFIEITPTSLEVRDFGDSLITECERNGELRIFGIGTIQSRPIGQLAPQSSSMGSYTGYYIDYADDREAAKVEAMRLARQKHVQMMTQIDKMLAGMQATELTFIPRPPKCKC